MLRRSCRQGASETKTAQQAGSSHPWRKAHRQAHPMTGHEGPPSLPAHCHRWAGREGTVLVLFPGDGGGQQGSMQRGSPRSALPFPGPRDSVPRGGRGVGRGWAQSRSQIDQPLWPWPHNRIVSAGNLAGGWGLGGASPLPAGVAEPQWVWTSLRLQWKPGTWPGLHQWAGLCEPGHCGLAGRWETEALLPSVNPAFTTGERALVPRDPSGNHSTPQHGPKPAPLRRLKKGHNAAGPRGQVQSLGQPEKSHQCLLEEGHSEVKQAL